MIHIKASLKILVISRIGIVDLLVRCHPTHFILSFTSFPLSSLSVSANSALLVWLLLVFFFFFHNMQTNGKECQLAQGLVYYKHFVKSFKLWSIKLIFYLSVTSIGLLLLAVWCSMGSIQSSYVCKREIWEPYCDFIRKWYVWRIPVTFSVLFIIAGS